MALKQPSINLGPIKAALGEEIPEITPTPLGRFRLVQALRHRFGDSWRTIGKAKQALQHFDSEHDYFRKLRKLQGDS